MLAAPTPYREVPKRCEPVPAAWPCWNMCPRLKNGRELNRLLSLSVRLWSVFPSVLWLQNSLGRRGRRRQ